MLFCSSWFVHSSIWRSCFLLRVVVVIELDLTYIRPRRRGRRLVKNLFLFYFGIFLLFGTSLCVFRYFKWFCGWSFPDSVEKTRNELALFTVATHEHKQTGSFCQGNVVAIRLRPSPPPPPPHCPIPAHLPSVHHALLYPGPRASYVSRASPTRVFKKMFPKLLDGSWQPVDIRLCSLSSQDK